MGNSGSKSHVTVQSGPIVTAMATKYAGSTWCLDQWVAHRGFPSGGSLSKLQLAKLRKNLEDERENMRTRKNVKAHEIWEIIDVNERCLDAWEKESERRERKQMAKKELTTLIPESQSVKPSVPTPTLIQPNVFFPSLHGKWDPLLDACPHAPPDFQPPLQLQPVAGPAPVVPQQLFQPPDVPQHQAYVPAGAYQIVTKVEPGLLGALKTEACHQVQAQQLTERDYENGAQAPDPPPLPPMRNITTRRKRGDEPSLQMPMLEAAGHEGPTLVYRPWTENEMREAVKHLPPITASGDRFFLDFECFCREFRPSFPEIKRLLILQLGAAKFAKIQEACLGRERLAHLNWNNDANMAYRNAMTALGQAIAHAFPAKIDMTKVTDCTQGADESTSEYMERLLKVFNEHCGIPEPDGGFARQDAKGAYEAHLQNCLLEGLRPDLAKQVKLTCVGYTSGRLAEVIRYAKHQERLQNEQKEMTEKDRKEAKNKAHLTMLQSVGTASAAPGYQQGGARGRRGGGRRPYQQNYQQGPQERPTPGDNVCFYCKMPGHWKGECPELAGTWGRGRGRGRGWGQRGSSRPGGNRDFQAD